MSIELLNALGRVEDAARAIFDADGSVRSVGVGELDGGYGFVAIRNTRAPVALAARIGGAPLPTAFDGIPVTYRDSHMDPVQLARVPHSGPARPGVGSVIPEQQAQTPLVCGLQVQNYDDDLRSGEIARGYIIIGTLGCFVQLADGAGILSNNHVLAGENRGVDGHDRIAHPGNAELKPATQVATLARYARLQTSPAGASVADGSAILNDIDAAVATLGSGINYRQAYLASRLAAAPQGAAPAQVGDKVHKVGRTTGLTLGTVRQVGAVVGPVGYGAGPCWFRRTIVIEGHQGATFSDHGDSGSVIVRDDGKVLGLLYAGNGTHTFACPIGDVLEALHCQLA